MVADRSSDRDRIHSLIALCRHSKCWSAQHPCWRVAARPHARGSQANQYVGPPRFSILSVGRLAARQMLQKPPEQSVRSGARQSASNSNHEDQSRTTFVCLLMMGLQLVSGITQHLTEGTVKGGMLFLILEFVKRLIHRLGYRYCTSHIFNQLASCIDISMVNR